MSSARRPSSMNGQPCPSQARLVIVLQREYSDSRIRLDCQHQRAAAIDRRVTHRSRPAHRAQQPIGQHGLQHCRRLAGKHPPVACARDAPAERRQQFIELRPHRAGHIRRAEKSKRELIGTARHAPLEQAPTGRRRVVVTSNTKHRCGHASRPRSAVSGRSVPRVPNRPARFGAGDRSPRRVPHCSAARTRTGSRAIVASRWAQYNIFLRDVERHVQTAFRYIPNGANVSRSLAQR